jgi:hypothetical protein
VVGASEMATGAVEWSGRDPGARVVAAAWPQERSGNGPGGAVGAVVASIVMAGAAHDVRRRVTQRGGTNSPQADRLRRVIT